jgi:ABC-2 type transport system permease protein
LQRWLELPKGLGNIVIKEVKEMARDPRILLGMILAPLIIFPLLGFMFRTSTEAVKQSLRTISICVADLDTGDVSKNLTNFLESNNMKIQSIDAQHIDETIASAQASNLSAIIIIPRDFSQNITNGKNVSLPVYGIFRGTGIAETASFSVVQSLLESFKQNIVINIVQTKFPNPNTVLNPVNYSQGSIVKGKPVNVSPTVLFSFAEAQSLGLPIALFMLIILAMQLAATSVASEKEEKTLETLMSLPVNRFTLLIGKLAGSTIIAAIGAVATIIGVSYYMGSITFSTSSQASVDLGAIGLTPSLLGYAILGISIFVSLLCALAIAVVVSVFAEDVRGAQSLLGFVYTPLVLPMFVLMFADINTLPSALRIFLLALPFTHPVLASQAAITGNYLPAILGIVYVTAFTLVILYIASRIFATEKILTMRFSLRRKKVSQE